MSEFGRNGCFAEGFGEACPVSFVPLAVVEPSPSVVVSTERLHGVSAALRGGSAAEPDGLPPELCKLAGRGIAKLLTQIAFASFSSGVPDN